LAQGLNATTPALDSLAASLSVIAVPNEHVNDHA